MYKIFLLLFFISNLYASMSELSALNQDIHQGSFFLESDRNFFRNPAFLKLVPNSIVAESKKEATYKNADYAISLSDKIFGAYQLNDMAGISGFIAPQNGKGIKSYGFTAGIDIEDEFSLYGGFKAANSEATPTLGFTIDCYSGKLYGEYKGEIFSVDDYEFTFGFGKQFKNYFADLSYNQINSDQRNLAVTVGATTMLMEKLGALASAKKELFFSNKMAINAGLTWQATRIVELTVAHSLIAFDLAKPKYKDFDATLSASYLF